MKICLGVDIGTQGTKGVLVDKNLRVLDRCYFRHGTHTPRPGLFEHNPETVWWGSFVDVVGRLMHTVQPKSIQSIACSGLSPCLLPADESGLLSNAILYNDTRAKTEIEETKRIAEESGLKTRNPITTQSIVPKILWFKKHIKEKKEPIKFFTSTNYISYKLTGEYTLDRSQAALYEPLYDFENKKWNKQACDAFEIPEDWLPRLKAPWELAGTIAERPARECHLTPGIPVAVSTSDGIAEMISLGIGKQGRVTLIYGSTGAIGSSVSAAPSQSPLTVIPDPLTRDSFLLLAATATAGTLISWFKDNFTAVGVQGEGDQDFYRVMEEEANRIPAGSEGIVLLPYFCGARNPINDGQARGGIIGLTTYHTKWHIYRAILEGIAYSFMHNLEVLESEVGSISQIVVGGGGARSMLGVQIVSDVTGFEQILPSRSTGSEIGAAYLAGISVGLINNLEKFQEGILQGSNMIFPNPQNHHTYCQIYKTYRKFYEHVKGEMHLLAELQDK